MADTRIVITGTETYTGPVDGHTLLIVADGGVASSVELAGTEIVGSGGVISQTQVEYGGYLAIKSGGSAHGVRVEANANLIVNSGGFVRGALVAGGAEGGPKAFLSLGGVAEDVHLYGGGYLDVVSGGKVLDLLIGSAGSAYVSSGAVASDVTANSHGELTLETGGSATDVLVDSSGNLVIAGTATGLTLYGGDLNGGSATDVTIMSGGNDEVAYGGIETNFTVMSGGTQTINYGVVSGGTVSGTQYVGDYDGSATAVAEQETLAGGSTVYVYSGGLVSGITIGAGGELFLVGGAFSGGTLQSGATINIGASNFVDFSTDIVSGVFVGSGALMNVYGGFEAASPTIDGGGSATILDQGNIAGTLTFAGVSATLTIDGGGILQAQVAGFGPTDMLVLSAINYGPNTGFTYSGTSAGGTLTVTDGTNTSAIQFTGNYSSSSFHDAGVVGGGTVITYG